MLKFPSREKHVSSSTLRSAPKRRGSNNSLHGDRSPSTGFSGYNAERCSKPEMSVHNPRRYEYRRNLPHFQNGTAAVFVTMATRKKLFLPSSARELILEHILREHKHRARIHCAVVMPDHAHILLSPALDESNSSAFGTAEIMNGIRGASAHRRIALTSY